MSGALLAFVVAVVAVISFQMGIAWAKPRRPDGPHVEVGQSADAGRPVPHTVSARIRDARGQVLHFARVDMREPDYEERLAGAVAEMKHKLRVIEAAQRIAEESSDRDGRL